MEHIRRVDLSLTDPTRYWLPSPSHPGLAGDLAAGYPPVPRPRAFMIAGSPAYAWKERGRVVQQSPPPSGDAPALIRAALCGQRCVKFGSPGGLLPSCDAEPAWWTMLSNVCPPCCRLASYPTTVLYGGPVAVRFYPQVVRLITDWVRGIEMSDPLGESGVVVSHYVAETEMLPLLHNGVLFATNPVERIFWPHIQFQWWWAQEQRPPTRYRVVYRDDGFGYRETLETA